MLVLGRDAGCFGNRSRVSDRTFPEDAKDNVHLGFDQGGIAALLAAAGTLSRSKEKAPELAGVAFLDGARPS